MRSLALKLTFAFLFIGVTGVAIFALLMGPRTRIEFDQYLSARDQNVMVGFLRDYYASTGSWNGVSQTLALSSIPSSYSHSAIVLDADHRTLIGPRDMVNGSSAPDSMLSNATVITSTSGAIIGYVIFTPINPQGETNRVAAPVGSNGSMTDAITVTNQLAVASPPGPPPENTFFDRLTTAAIISAGATILVALVLGGILARTLTHPLAELTQATQAMAGGKLDQKVKVRSHDEIGTLAKSFNQMSADVARGITLRKQMTADLAHDLRTPLTILSGYTEGLSEERLKGTPALYKVMHDEVKHLQRLVDDLRTLSLADARELPLNKRVIDPRALLEQTGLAFIGQLEQRGLDLRVEAPEALPSISVDTERMTQVLNNLVTNALRYTTQGEIILRAKQAGQYVLLQVSDTGAGIDAEHIPFIFDRFYRADPSRQRSSANGDSSGLGLAIAKAIVEAQDGTISVESTPGHGTTFTITLPIAA